MNIELKEHSTVSISGDQAHPANLGRLCSKGSALGETLVDENRLLRPTLEGNEVSWDVATDAIAEKIANSIERHGLDSVAFYLSGQLLTEDYYVANKLMKGFIGTANVDTNSRLCMSSAVAGYKRAFGSDTVPCSYEDLDHADLLILVGSNAAWTHPILYQRMVTAKEANPNLRVVLIDPRVTASANLADLHLAITPSSDGFLFQGLLRHLIDQQALDLDYIEAHTNHFSKAKSDVETLDTAYICKQTGVDESKLARFYDWFTRTRKVVTFYSQGINQSATGTDKCNAIINCHLATGKLGYAGAGPFSITGQPNAMGGREVGGLSNQLAAHMDFAEEDTARVQRFWQSPTIAQKPGLKAVELFDAVAAGDIKVIWIMATNPAVSLPMASKVRDALARCETVIVSDVTHTDTTRYANILLPVLGWSEKDGTVTNSERCISRQRAFVDAPGDAKADWWVVSQVAKKLGFSEAFNYPSAHAIFSEHASLSGFENDGARDFDISGLSALSEADYRELEPIQWPVRSVPQAHAITDTPRMFANGHFYTPNNKANFVSNRARLADSVASPYLLNTGRMRDQWHTMSRTGLAPSLSGHSDIPFVQINPIDARQLKLVNDQFARLYTDSGEYVARVDVTAATKPGEFFSPIHWNSTFASSATVGDIVSPEVDPVSGQPQLKASAVSIEPFRCWAWARIASTLPIVNQGFKYWAQARTSRGYISLLGVEHSFNWRDLIPSGARTIEYSGANNEHSSLLATGEQQEISALIYTHKNVERLPSASWLRAAFDLNDAAQLPSLLRSESGVRDRLVCSCFKVSEKAIKAELKNGASSVFELGARLGCGAKCGSCKPELAALIV